MIKAYQHYFIFIVLLNALALKAQIVAGHVYDDTNVPLEGAVVYFDGTSNSVSTDAKGSFTIKGDRTQPAPLIISFVGFVSVKIANPYTGNKLRIILEPDAIEMEAVVVTGKTLFSRKEMLRAFKNQFLGSSKAGASCTIENEDDIRLRFDTSNNTLYAEALKPLRIKNERLKYIVTFDLVASEVRYKAKTLDPNRIAGAFFGGTTFFTDISGSSSAVKQRKEAYRGSPAHFIKTVINEDWAAQKFRLFSGSWGVDPKRHFVVKDTLGIKKVTCLEPEQELTLSAVANTNRQKPGNIKKQRFEVLYNNKEESFFIYNDGIFYANENGLYWPLQELTFGGYMGGLRVGDMLPSDYNPQD